MATDPPHHSRDTSRRYPRTSESGAGPAHAGLDPPSHDRGSAVRRGPLILVWWLMAIAGGARAYGDFTQAATHPLGLVLLIGLTWAFFQHLLSGIRHLVMDTGAGFELQTNKRLRRTDPGRLARPDFAGVGAGPGGESDEPG